MTGTRHYLRDRAAEPWQPPAAGTDCRRV